MDTPIRSWYRKLLVLALVPALLCDAAAAAAPNDVLATVNGAPIRTSDLELLWLVRRIPDAQRPAVREQCLEELIDQRLMAAFLAGRRTQAEPAEVEARIAGLNGALSRGGKDPAAELQRLGISDDTLRSALALPLAWQQHVRRVVTAEQLAEYWAARHARYDGARRHISQIVLTVPSEAGDAARQETLARMQSIKSDIEAGRTTFADAARQHSTSPSRAQGGDVGWVVYGTRLPHEISDVAFALPVKTVSDPFVTRFGVHLVLVTAEERGDLSLEDVRGEVLNDLGRQLWDEQLAKERQAAKIVRLSPP